MADIRENVELRSHTVFKIGGPARYFCEARTLEELRDAVRFAHANSVPFFTLGAGSNVLISDRGFNGLAIKIALSDLSCHDTRLEADAGVSMARAVAGSVDGGLAGFEWGVGIPGTIGGSVRGNAGCFGGEIKDVLHSVRLFNTLSEMVQTISVRACQFGYRHSIFKEHPEWIIVSAIFYLDHGNRAESQQKIADYSKKRRATQDIGSQCAGCMFKNVAWDRAGVDKSSLTKKFPELRQFSASSVIPAAFLLDYLGLKGTAIGGAAISNAHANYFVNVDNSSAENVASLVSLAKDRVRRAFGIQLEEEVQFVS